MTEISATLFADLRSAFVAEATTTMRLTHFAHIAEVEGLVEVARVLKELAESAECVAQGHLDLFRDLTDPVTGRPFGDTRLNLAAILASETQAATALYPALARDAHAEGLADTASWLETLCALKRAHLARLDQAYTVLAEGAATAPDSSTTN